ncbi:MAG: Protein Smg [bacterium]|nr:Protein Smg [bacterium]
MNERVVEILVYIMNEMRGERTALNHLEVISRDLQQRGYTENEISSAFSWLYERYQNENEELVRHTGPTLPGSFRVLHDMERIVIAPAGYGYLLQLKHLGILDDAEVEQVIERAMMIGATRLSEEAIKSIVASTLFNLDNGSGAFFVLEDSAVVH